MKRELLVLNKTQKNMELPKLTKNQLMKIKYERMVSNGTERQELINISY